MVHQRGDVDLRDVLRAGSQMTVDDSGRYSPGTLYSKIHGAVRAKLDQAKVEAESSHQRSLNTLQVHLQPFCLWRQSMC